MIIRPLAEKDLSSLLRIESATQISPWSEGVFIRCLQIGSVGWVAEVANQMVGFIIVLIQHTEAHILNLCVDPPYQNQKIGQTLLAKALAEAVTQNVALAYLEVRISNRKAIHIYKKMGFSFIQERKNYYTREDEIGRENALVLVKHLL